MSHDHVAITQRGRHRELVDLALEGAGLVRRRVLTVPSAYGAVMAAARSPLIACVPDMVARSVASALGLVIFKLPVAVPVEQVVQAWHPRDEVDPAHRWLRECVAAIPRRPTFGPLAGGRDNAAMLAMLA